MSSGKTFILFSSLSILIFFSLPTFAEPQPKELCNQVLAKDPLVKIDPNTYAFRGVTDLGLEELKNARDILRERSRLFDLDLRNLGSVHHVGTIARLLKSHIFLYGPPGGAKSAFVDWFMKGEVEEAFRLQLHQMITEQAFIGGQNFEAAKEGRFELNTEGSMVDYAITLLDEVEKGQPGALASLMSLLNERKVLLGNKVITARLETLFATSNANLPEFFQQFVENGQGTTAPALLNRFQFKAFIYNWLSIDDQAFLDQRRQRRQYLKNLAETYPEVLKSDVFLDPKPLNWPALRQLANTLFTLSPLAMTAYRELVNEMRDVTNRTVRESEERHRTNHLDEPFVYFPSADYTERLRQQIPEVILMSAFVDFMMSPLADDLTLAQLTQKQIQLDPLSLWRGYLIMTTIGPGEIKLKFDPTSNAQGAIDIDFDWSIDPSTARDKREELLIKNLKDEQERFRRAFLNMVKKQQAHIELRVKNSASFDISELENNSFELLMLRQGK